MRERGTKDAPAAITDYIYSKLDVSVVAIILFYTKAFDNDNHMIFLQKLDIRIIY